MGGESGIVVGLTLLGVLLLGVSAKTRKDKISVMEHTNEMLEKEITLLKGSRTAP